MKAPARTKSTALAVPNVFIDFDGKSEIPADTLANARVALERLTKDRGLRFSHNLFTGKKYAGGIELNTDVGGQISDEALSMIRVMIRDAYDFNPGKNNTWDAINLVCREHGYHPIKDYLSSVKWDGVARIDTWMIDHLGAPDTPFVRGVSRIVLVASVRRIYQPGAKFDYMTVLESPEGFNKSSVLAALYGREFFSDQTLMGLDDKQLQETLRGRWCIECADLSGLRKAEVEKVKAQLSRQEDRSRPAYGRAVIDAPRSCVFWGTTNDQEYLQSQTGNRRFLPVPIQRIDVETILAARDQLWAEAMDAEAVADSIMLPEELWTAAGAEQDKRTMWHPWIDSLTNAARVAARHEKVAEPMRKRGDADAVDMGPVYDEPGDGTERVSSKFLLHKIIGIPADRVTAEHGKQVGRAMRKNGWTGPDPVRIKGRTVKGYMRRMPDPCA
jgi:predicted P-loop ATPase